MKIKPIIARNAAELAEVLGLSPADGVEMELRYQLNNKIIAATRESGLTRAQLAEVAGTSRSRLIAILNRNTTHISTNLLLRILTAFGYHAKITITRARRAA
jgi:predicted XRE-type DNA-binding protein